MLRDVRHLLDRAVERFLVRSRRLREATDLAHVLQSRRADFLIGGGGFEVVERSDVAAHAASVDQRPSEITLNSPSSRARRMRSVAAACPSAVVRTRACAWSPCT